MARRLGAALGTNDEASLVERARAGDESAVTAIYHGHATYLASVVYRLLGSDADLDDIVQEAFVEGLRQLDALRDPAKLRSFLVTIAVRRIHERISFRYRMKHLSQRLFGIAPRVSDPADVDPIHALYQLLARQPTRQRIAWVLHRMEGYTLPEVAEQSSASLATVKRWIANVDEALEASHASE